MAKKVYTNMAAANVNNFTHNTDEKTDTKEDRNAPVSPQKTHRGPGRPSKGETFNISLKVPISMKNDIEKASLAYGGNKTKYLIHLVEEDLKKNQARYEELDKLLNENN